MGASVRCSHHVPVQSVTSQGPDSGLSLVGGGSGRSLLVRTRDSELQGPCQRIRPQQNPLSGAAKLELEMESRGSQAKAVGQRLLQAYIPQKTGLQAVSSGQRGSVLRWFITVVLNAAFLGMGVSAAVLGPTFPDLARNVNRNVSSLSEIFVGRALGYLCGSVVGGVLFDCMNHFLLLGGNVLILNLWGDKGAPHMQALHFSFALGAFLAPLLAKLAWGTSASTQNHTDPGFDRSALNRSSEATSDSLFAVPEDMNLLWAYASTGTYVLVVSVFLFAPFFNQSSRQKKSTASGNSEDSVKNHQSRGTEREIGLLTEWPPKKPVRTKR
ncbi:Sodium-dependent glucose transporter 1 [Cricetulus griseus]|uniref:Sodium-dependent glucose transporter 1 n=1 Tax=Cricetulus griseus TaxID=10029 RepID=G3HMS4_CRIGR|nr:Sodium-dependent glucose transporter 1 [Cricetulus griseus]